MKNKKPLLSLLFLAAVSFTIGQEPQCVESNQWKFDDYTKKPLLANQIFTKGFGIFLEFKGKEKKARLIKDSVTNLLLNGFRTALTNWGVSLMINGDEMPPEIRNYIDEYTMKSEGQSQYNAPQVFQVDCPENANFVLHIYFKSGKNFLDQKGVLAKAQVKGRTILVNMKDHKMIYNQKLFDLKLGADLNIVPILAHELGHSFGLSHVEGEECIMAGALTKMSRFPNKKDGIRLAKNLLSVIKGTAAGYFSPTECQGLKLN